MATVLTRTFDPLTLEILWNRLIATVDEMAAVLVRTSFSTVVGAANDFGCEIMDADGRSLAHATRSMPVFNRTMPNVTRKIIEKYGRENMRPGDVFICNDPWMAAGHADDVAVVTPVFRESSGTQRVIAFTGSIANVSNIGGVLNGNLARESYDEGLFMPITYFFKEGVVNDLVVDLFRWNVRVPDMVIGDLYAEAAANEIGAQKILALLDEYGLDDFEALGTEIQQRTDTAMRKAIAAIPPGSYHYEVEFDEIGVLTIAVTVTFDGETVTVDFTGSSPQQPQGGINCTYSYIEGQTSYAMKYLLIPEVPENEGCYGAVNIVAPEGSIVNCRFPASVRNRTRSGWYLHSALAGALQQILPDRVMAPTGLLGGIRAYGTTPDGRSYFAHMFSGGGMGAGSTSDGMPSLIFPSSASNVPVEMFEVAAPVLMRQKEYLTDSGGPGRQRGGVAARATFSRLPGWERPVIVGYSAHRMRVPCFGLRGGGDGTAAQAHINGRVLSREEYLNLTGGYPLTDDETVCGTDLAGGGGFESPRERPAAQVLEDVIDGYVSPASAELNYGVAIDSATMTIDEARTRALREGAQ